MLKKHPAIGRLVRLPSRVVTIVGFEGDYFIVKVGTKKPEKVTESFMMEHGILISKDWQEKTPKGALKSAPMQEYVNRYFGESLEARRTPILEVKTFVGFKIEDEVVEDFIGAIAEE